MTCDESSEILASYALGALPDEERDDLEAHLQGCPACRLVLEQDREVVEELPRGIRLVDPPPGLKSKLMAQVSAYESERRGEASHALPAKDYAGEGRGIRIPLIGSFARRPRHALMVSLTGLTILLVSWTAVQSFRISDIESANDRLTTDVEHQREALAFVTSPGVETVTLVSDQQPGARGSLFMDHKENEFLMIISDISPTEKGFVYQLWVRTSDGLFFSLGTFNAYRDGYVFWRRSSTMAVLESDSLAVTIEPDGGSEWPGQQVVLRGDVGPGFRANAP